jgi:hypothetical protein
MGRVPSGRGVVSFRCGIAREIGFDARDEPDPDAPDNPAHAHLYCDHSVSQRKKLARKLVVHCRTEIEPVF